MPCLSLPAQSLLPKDPVYTFPYSHIDTQKDISAILTQIRQTIAANQQENQRLTELRDTLLPKLMSGELDVSDIEL